ncbi:MAG: YbhB/YbcL family Raf kinase inhibitor-like protein [Bacteroidota bacterium]|nr:YbhB/YbcL family Raf kinase inhibitor-like protein [Bacteroidota bacterium]
MRTFIAILLLLVPVLIIAQISDQAGNFTLSSSDLGGQANDQQVFNAFGCSGKNISPQLAWRNPPEGTRSFAITMYDPDAPTGSGWWHWVVYDIPFSMKEIPAGAGSADGTGLPKGATQSITDFGMAGYGGPCPPPGHGPHQYVITIHALDVEKLEVPANASPALIGFNSNSHSLARASLIFYHGRK